MPSSITAVLRDATPSPSNGRVAIPCSSVPSSTSVTPGEATRLPSSAPRKLDFLCTSRPFTAEEMPPMNSAACCGSNTTGTRCVFGLRAPSIRAARRAARVAPRRGLQLPVCLGDRGAVQVGIGDARFPARAVAGEDGGPGEEVAGAGGVELAPARVFGARGLLRLAGRLAV